MALLPELLHDLLTGALIGPLVNADFHIASPLCSSVLFFLPVDFITLLIPSPGPVTLQVGQQMVTGVLEFIPIESQAHQPPDIILRRNNRPDAIGKYLV